MSNARDKANIPALNFSSTGIDDNATSTAITIDSSGNIGIGNTNPADFSGAGGQNLVVGSGSGAEGITIYSSTTADGVLGFADGSSGTDDYRGFLIYKHNGDAFQFGTSSSERMRLNSTGLGIGTSSPNEKLDSRGSAVFSGDHSTATNAFGTSHGILISSTPNLGKITAISNGANDVKLELRGLDGGSANSNQLVLDGGTSNVGIGTSSPQYPLEVTGVTLVNGNLIVTGGTDTADRRAGITHDGSSLIFKASGNSTNRNIIFHRSGDGSADETMRIDSSTNVLVGTTIGNGDVDNFRNLSAGRFYTRRTFHTFSATNTWETVETLSSNSGTYLLTTIGSGGGNPTTDNYIGFLSVNGSGTHIQDIKTATKVEVQMSGLNLQIKQQFFSTANITYSLLKLNN